MKAKLALSVVFALTLSALLVAVHADDTSAVSWAERAVDGILEAYDHQSVLIIGELHGTQETPVLVDTLAQRLASDRRVALGLEISRQEQERIGAFLRSDGNPRALAELLAGEFWQVEPNHSDGRRSDAMVELLQAIRAARFAGYPVSVVALDDVVFHAEGTDRRQGMADRIVELSEDSNYDVVLALLGNYHARLIAPSGPITSRGELIEPPIPTAARISAVPVTSVNVTACSGGFWACRSPGSCGPIELPGECAVADYPLVYERDGSRDAYHSVVVLERLTPSPPAPLDE